MVKETRKRRGRALKVKRVEDEQMSDKPAEIKKTGSHAEHAEKTAEWRAVKSAIAKLKEERKKLGKKERERKKQLSKDIKKLMHDAIERGLTGKAQAEAEAGSDMEL
jgi:hypothetical protein